MKFFKSLVHFTFFGQGHVGVKGKIMGCWLDVRILIACRHYKLSFEHHVTHDRNCVHRSGQHVDVTQLHSCFPSSPRVFSSQ